MAWTTPRDWVAGEVVLASQLNTHIRDNENYLFNVAETAWTDYSASTTLVGWSSTTIKKVFYRVEGKKIFFIFYIGGTSNATSASFTLPNSIVDLIGGGSGWTIHIAAQDNGSNSIAANALIGGGSPTITLYPSYVGSLWTASGTKSVSGEGVGALA